MRDFPPLPRLTFTRAMLLAYLPMRRDRNETHLEIPYDLRHHMRRAHVTLHELSAEMNVPMTRIHEIASMPNVPYILALDYQDGIERAAARKAQEAA